MTTKSTRKEKTPRECLCGCGSMTRGGRYIPGHDSRHKKALIEAALGGSKRAVTKLESFGWSKFLDAKREKLAKEQGIEPVTAAASTGEAEPRRRGGRRKRTDEVTPVAIESEASMQPRSSATEENAGDSTPAN